MCSFEKYSDLIYLFKREFAVYLAVSPKHSLHGQLLAFDFEVDYNLF